MRQRTKKLVAAIGIAALAVVGFDTYTYAGTGDSLILGKFNKANKTTHVTSTGKGPALALHAKGDRPALAVDSNAKIVKLNADRVDGREAAALQNNVRVYTATSTAQSAYAHRFELPDFPRGRYQATFDMLMYGSLPAEGQCYFANGSAYAAYAATSTNSMALGVSGSDVIVKNAAAWSLYCQASQLWTVHEDFPVRVTLTRIDKTIGGSLDDARTGGDAHPSTDLRH